MQSVWRYIISKCYNFLYGVLIGHSIAKAPLECIENLNVTDLDLTNLDP